MEDISIVKIRNIQSPKPYCKDPKNVKAFVLGCDPTAFDKSQNRLEFEYVFNIGGTDKRYFSSILKNLNTLDLSLDNIYVQNLITDYLDNETCINGSWARIAEEYIPLRKQEFDKIDPTGLKPVMLTSEYLYKVLINHDQVKYSARELYENENLVPIKAEHNKLGRPLIPLYRHIAYSLTNKIDYQVRIKEYINGIKSNLNKI